MSSQVDTAVVKISEVSTDVKAFATNDYLERLPRAKYASFDCERPDPPSSCFEGTRMAILKLIEDWVLNIAEGSPRFFWLNGIAGVGKTTVARTIALLLRNRGLLGANFFFSRRGEAELRTPAIVFPTIAYQLARFHPDFSDRITAALKTDPEAPYASLSQQLERLLLKPLEGLKRNHDRVVVLVFDAFDECEPEGAKEILQLLVAAMPRLPFFLKIFVTGRPEHHIRTVLVPSSNLGMTALHDIEASIVKSDILLFIRARIREIAKERGMELPPDWITEEEILLVAEKAGNLFIHAATSLRFLLEGWHPRQQLDILLTVFRSQNGGSTDAQPFLDLDALYHQILVGIIPAKNAIQSATQLRLVLGTIILLRDPLPVAALECLIGQTPGIASSILSYLHSLILAPPPADVCPQVHHPSLPDFLQDHRRCTDIQLWVDVNEHEPRMLLRCLRLLNSQLRTGMIETPCHGMLNSEVDDLEKKINDSYPPELQYACRHWASHLVMTSSSNTEIGSALEEFATRSILPWLEAMSWLGASREAIRLLEGVKIWLVCQIRIRDRWFDIDRRFAS